MSELLFNIFIFPIVQIIEISFTIAFRILKNRALAIIGVSAAVTVCTMPLYFIAEKWQRAERELQKKLKPKIDKIKSVFKGDEQYMLLSAYYRQNHYHPIYSLRNSLSILIQIPFFIAAYSYLSHLDLIKGASFLFIKDLGAPDSLFSLGGIKINILPILMTIINCVSGAIYTREHALRDKLQIYGMALIFLFLLYNSPAGLVFYWTINNIFSLIKNILSNMKQRKKILYIILCVFSVFAIIRFLNMGISSKRYIVVGLFSLIFFAPLILKLFRIITDKISKTFNLKQSSLSTKNTFIFSCLILLVLCGLVIPSSLIASSVQEFSFIDSYTAPLPFIFSVFIQAIGIFIFWPICIYFLFSNNVKYALTYVLSLICITALINTFIFQGNFGSITTTFKFSTPNFNSIKENILYGIVTFVVIIIFSFLLLNKGKLVIYALQLITLTSLSFLFIFNIIKINKEFKYHENILFESNTNSLSTDNPEPVFHFSRNGKNVLIIMLDAAISGFIPHIFNEKQYLLQDFSGFVYYPNCVSLGSHTRIGIPLIFGGYEYEPSLINKNRTYAKEKHNEALLMMPRIFLNENYNVTVIDPSLANYSHIPDLSIYSSFPDISAKNINGNYTGNWLRLHPEIKLISVSEILKELLIRFSLFKIVPPPLRVFIYDNSQWLKPNGIISNNHFSQDLLDRYTTLDSLPLLTEILDNSNNTYTTICSDLPHDSAFLQYPDYVPAVERNENDKGTFSVNNYYHVNIASFLLVGKWLNYLQEQGVYDNIRIIIASDHGKNITDTFEGNIQLPNGHPLTSYNALLLVKDFNAHGDLVTDTVFMTNADIPSITMENLIENQINPFTGNSIKNNKENGVYIATTGVLDYEIPDDHWLYVNDNIFDPINWRLASK